MVTPLENDPAARSTMIGSRKLAWAAVLVLVPALAVRLGWPDTISFGGEQIDAIALAWRAWHEGLPDRGLRVSVGVDMPPLFLWFLMIPVALTRDPILVTGAFALANLAGLALLGAALRRSLGARIAWMTVLILASAPWSVLFSRKIWAQDLILPLHALFLWALVRWLESRTRARGRGARRTGPPFPDLSGHVVPGARTPRLGRRVPRAHSVA